MFWKKKQINLHLFKIKVNYFVDDNQRSARIKLFLPETGGKVVRWFTDGNKMLFHTYLYDTWGFCKSLCDFHGVEGEKGYRVGATVLIGNSWQELQEAVNVQIREVINVLEHCWLRYKTIQGEAIPEGANFEFDIRHEIKF